MWFDPGIDDHVFEEFDKVEEAENKLTEIKSVQCSRIILVVKGRELNINFVEIVTKVKLEEKSEISIRAWNIIELKKCEGRWIILEFDHDREIVKLAKWGYFNINSNMISCIAPKLKPEMEIPISELEDCHVIFNW